MALRNQPYLPLYVQDFLTDEKLNECSAESTGVYIRLMCIMHKSQSYGKILLKQKDKQNGQQILNFAVKLARQMPYSVAVIERAITELLEEEVISMEGDCLYQKRMVKDAKLSDTRASASRQRKSRSKNAELADDFASAKSSANSENEIENENVYGDGVEKEDSSKLEAPTTPRAEEATGKKKQRRQKIFDAEDKAYLLAKYLSSKIAKRLPTTTPADEATLQRWADAFDKCNRIDGHDWEEIKQILRFSQEDPFWQQNILSGGQFREKYMQLLSKWQGNMRRESPQQAGRLTNTMSMLRGLHMQYQEDEQYQGEKST